MGSDNIETAAYTVIQSDPDVGVELRHYERLTLVSAPMGDGRNAGFSALFNYISGENIDQSKIAMTAPVLMDEQDAGTKIAMTAPVFMDESASEPMMSFVLPASYTLSTAPKPINDSVRLSEIKDYTVAAIRFSGRLTVANTAKHESILREWMAANDVQASGEAKTAGYNAPFTLPQLRRNEVIIPIVSE